MQSEVHERPDSIPNGINILLLDFFCFYVVKPQMPMLALLPMLCVCEKPYFKIYEKAYLQIQFHALGCFV